MPRARTLTGQIRELCDKADRLAREEGRNFADRALWRILTALRGPDNEDQLLKSQTTARLRAAVCPAASTHADVCKGEIMDVSIYSSRPNGRVPPHFALHMKEATWALQDLGIDETEGDGEYV